MKRLIFCFDGTCNDPKDSGDFFSDSSISNVLKLHALFGGSLNPANAPNKKTPNQHSFYYSGVGTYGGWFRKKWNAIFAPRGADMAKIIRAAKKDLKAHFRKGDEIFIFGFSRGAAIARIFTAKHVNNRRIKFLGVFDTVAAVKKSLDLKKDTYPASGILFENGTLGKHVEKAVHLVSIDEKRLAFQPTLFNKDNRVTEIWFAGVHSDIGGGYWFDGLSDVALKFMCDKAKAAGLKLLKENELDYKRLREKNTKEEAICVDDISILPITYGKMHEQQRSGIAAKTLAPRLVRVNVGDKPSNEAPLIHKSVCERFMKVAGYRPYALRDRPFKVVSATGSVGKIRHGIKGLRSA